MRVGSPAERGQPGTDPAVRLEPGADGRVRLHLARLEALDEPATLVALRELVARMLPRLDLPEVLLEVDAWTGYLAEFTHVAESGTRMEDLATSMAAALVAEGCNLGLAPVVKPGHPALTRDRLSHVRQNYLRTDTRTAANARLIEAQAGIERPAHRRRPAAATRPHRTGRCRRLSPAGGAGARATDARVGAAVRRPPALRSRSSVDRQAAGTVRPRSPTPVYVGIAGAGAAAAALPAPAGPPRRLGVLTAR